MSDPEFKPPQTGIYIEPDASVEFPPGQTGLAYRDKNGVVTISKPYIDVDLDFGTEYER